MIGKNIKKALNSKIDKWLEHVDNEDVKKAIQNNAIVTGGAIVSMLTGQEVNDYDVYFKTKEACETVARYYVSKFNETHDIEARVDIEDERIKVFIQSHGIAGESEEDGISDETEPYVSEQEILDEKPKLQDQSKPKYRPVFLSTNAISLSDKIQIVIRFYGTPEEIHANYDFIHCTCWYAYYNNTLELPARALEAIINKELYYTGSKYPLCSIIRTRKFLARGWTINAGQYLKMALQLNNLDLHDLDVFEDQLVGVDSAYFNQAISQIRSMKEKNPDFKVDNTYLFEVINRIF